MALVKCPEEVGGGTVLPPQPPGPELRLIDWSWQEEHGYAIAEGKVQNISAIPMEHVTAVVSFMTADGTFISSADALIEYQPILPGQASPFKVMKSWNPAMKRASVEFKRLFGGTIPWDRPPTPTPRPAKK